MNRPEGRSALITGAARGIGAAFARAYAAEGATVAVADILLDEARATAEAIGPAACPVQLDVTRRDSIDAAMAAVRERAGGLDFLVSNAGVYDMDPVPAMTRESFDRLFAVKVAGTILTLQAAARLMTAQGRGGEIVNVSSQAGRRGEALSPTAAPPRRRRSRSPGRRGSTSSATASTSTPSPPA